VDQPLAAPANKSRPPNGGVEGGPDRIVPLPGDFATNLRRLWRTGYTTLLSDPHLSNAGLYERNSGLTGTGIRLGYLFDWPASSRRTPTNSDRQPSFFTRVHAADGGGLCYHSRQTMPRRTFRMPPVAPPFILGWGEWVALPDLGLPAIKAKVDTGARTSALHAFSIEPVRSGRRRLVRFGVHPIQRRADIRVECIARLVDQRDVTSSNGDREKRYVISTPIRIGDREWEIEVTLTNRDAMSYRMLLGRQAISGGILVDPASSFRQPRLRYKLYEPTGNH